MSNGVPALLSRARQATGRRGRTVVLCSLLLVVGLGAFIYALRSSRSRSPLFPASGARLAEIDSSFSAIADGERDAPRYSWDPEFVVSKLGRDPQILFRWVRRNTFWIPYHGSLRGPTGVLLDRHGNSLDRALLLATLLDK